MDDVPGVPRVMPALQEPFDCIKSAALDSIGSIRLDGTPGAVLPTNNSASTPVAELGIVPLIPNI